MAVRKQYCAACGEFLGEYNSPYPNEESCGQSECERDIREMDLEEQAAREERAAMDNYERY